MEYNQPFIIVVRIPYTQIMEKRWICATIVVMCLIHVLDAYPSGAGLSACSKLTPNHEEAPEPSEYTSPYSVKVLDDLETYSAKIPITVRVTSASLPWQGIFLQARRFNGTGTVGQWDQPLEATNTRTMRCDAEDDTITHRNTAAKSTLEFTWNPPDRDEGPIIFTGVIAANKDMWWNDQSSQILIPFDYKEPTTTVATTLLDTKITTERTTAPDEKTKQPTEDYDGEEDYEYPENSGASIVTGLSVLMGTCALAAVLK